MSDEKDTEIKKVAVEEKMPDNVTPLTLFWLFLKLAFANHLGKTIILLVVGLFVLITGLVVHQFYANNTNIFEVIREGRATLSSNAPPTLDPNKYDEIAKRLTKDGAKSVSIYEVDLGLAARKLVYAEIDGEQSQAYIEDRDSLYARLNPRDTDDDKIRKANYNENVIRLQNGESTCQKLEANARYGEFLLKNGVVSTCGIGLPTGSKRHFVGVVVVGFDKELESGQEDLMRSSLFIAAESILIKH